MQIRLTTPQSRFFSSDARFVAMVSGFGAGKTNTLVLKMLEQKFKYPKVDMGYFAPTYPLVRDILYPRISDILGEAGLRFRIHRTEHVIYIAGFGRIICRTMDVPERIIGFEIGHAFIDEFDTLKTQAALDVWRKIMARIRQKFPDGSENRILVATTPEGFRATYQLFALETRPGYELVTASTHSNAANLPEGYIESLRMRYPPQLIEAYLDGRFVNMASGSVYPDFSRKLNHTPAQLRPDEPVHVGMDFNVLNMTAAVSVIRENQPVTVDEIVGVRDTPAMAQILVARFAKRGHPVTIYPDASGAARRTVNAAESDISILRTAGLTVRANASNPAVRDRVNAVNALILNDTGERRWLINTDRCPTLCTALEQQAYTEDGEPDKRTGFDHAVDAAGYFLAHRWPLVRRSASQSSMSLY